MRRREGEREPVGRFQMNETEDPGDGFWIPGNPCKNQKKQTINPTCQVLVHRDPPTSECSEGGEYDKGGQEEEN